MFNLNGWSFDASRMVGRNAQLAALEAHVTAATGGHGRIVFVAGDAGIGKTRLIRELLARQAGRVEVLVGQCYLEDPAVPFGPIVDALRGELQRAGRDAFVARAGPWVRDLAMLLPELEIEERAGRRRWTRSSESGACSRRCGICCSRKTALRRGLCCLKICIGPTRPPRS